MRRAFKRALTMFLSRILWESYVYKTVRTANLQVERKSIGRSVDRHAGEWKNEKNTSEGHSRVPTISLKEK